MEGQASIASRPVTLARTRRVGAALSMRALMAQMLVFLASLVALPLAYAVWLSLTDFRFGQEAGFIGPRNYRTMLSDPDFWNGLYVTFLLYVLSLGMHLALGCYLGMLLNRLRLGRRFPQMAINRDIAISAFSPKPGPAWYFIQWATSKAMDERLAFDGIAPPRNSVFAGEKFGKWVAELPVRQHWVEALKAMGANGLPGSAPPQVSKVPEAGEPLGTAITRVMQGQASAHDAGCELDDKLVSLIAR